MTEGLAREGFDRDLAFGEERETAFVEALRDCTVECKADQKARVTGNVFIEYRQHGRPSGIATTRSRWYAIEVEDDRWIVLRTADLKALAEQAFRNGMTKRGGDGDMYEGALIPLDWLVRRWRPAR